MLEERGGVIIAVSLNVINASNSISWDLEEVMNFFDLLEYLQEILWDYFQGCVAQFTDCIGREGICRFLCGVPQGSVLGHFCGTSAMMWFYAPLPPPAATSSIMQMTLSVIGGNSWREAADHAEIDSRVSCEKYKRGD